MQLDLSLLKQREKNDLADVFEMWQRSGFNQRDLRDEFLLKHYGNRYDR